MQRMNRKNDRRGDSSASRRNRKRKPIESYGARRLEKNAHDVKRPRRPVACYPLKRETYRRKRPVQTGSVLGPPVAHEEKIPEMGERMEIGILDDHMNIVIRKAVPDSRYRCSDRHRCDNGHPSSARDLTRAILPLTHLRHHAGISYRVSFL
jgi:hypothetical protein